MRDKVKVLFVCMGNICRSPSAHGVFRARLIEHGLDDVVEVDSAGTHAYHVGEPPDPRAQNSARQRGVDISDLRARRVQAEDFHRFDYILAMDSHNHGMLMELCPDEHRSKVRLFLEFAPNRKSKEVPDPYYGGASGFDRVLEMIEEAAQGLLEEIRRNQLVG